MIDVVIPTMGLCQIDIFQYTLNEMNNCYYKITII